ncbi:CAP domain-containing protein [Corallincola platygyrae]|uniref:CAP domain-containing protein n=1 Tax=Corallincola platygyrae TaxID=1193278 RepID=A0ABW4XJ61_9GAMM
MKWRFLFLIVSVLVVGCGGSSSVDNALSPAPEDSVDDGSGDDSTGGEDDSGNEEEDTSPDTPVDYSQNRCSDDLSQVIALINEIRSQPQQCGDDDYPAVAPLTSNTLLNRAAEGHSANMANYDFFSHTGLDESTPGSRVSDQGYNWRFVAENIAAGQSSAQQVVDGWMGSPGHCRNIMSSQATEMGLACVENASTTYTRYWTQVFATPQ